MSQKFAVLDENNKVVDIIMCEDSNVPPRPVRVSAKQHLRNYMAQVTGKTCIEIPENTRHVDVTGTPFIDIGATYDPVEDRLIPLKPFPSWIWNSALNSWMAPVPYPEYYGEDAVYMKCFPYMTDPDPKKVYFWDEGGQQWFLPAKDKFGNAYTDEEGYMITDRGIKTSLRIVPNLPSPENSPT